MKNETMPCPRCNEQLLRSSETKSCPNCAAPLRLLVPIFAINAPPYGWRWELLPTDGDKVVVCEGEFRGRVLLIGRVYDTLIELKTLDRDSGEWVSFCSVNPQEFSRLTRPL